MIDIMKKIFRWLWWFLTRCLSLIGKMFSIFFALLGRLYKRLEERVTRGRLRAADDFQPDAIMLENQRPPFTMHIVWLTVVLLLLILTIWACLAKVDKIVTATGKVVTTRPPVSLKTLEITTIKKVHVRIGQRVKKNEILFTFNQTINMQELQRLQEQYISYKASERRLETELNGYVDDMKLPENPSKDDFLQQRIYISRKNYYFQKVRSFDENIARYRKTLETYTETMKKYESRKEKLSRIEKMYEELHSKKVTSLKDFLEVQVQTIATAIQVDQQAVSIVENRQQILYLQAERSAFIREWQKTMVEDLVDIRRNLTSLEREIPKYQMKVQFTELRSPCDGVIHELAPFQEGSGVREAEALVTIIPTDCLYEVEIDIPAKDISWVRLGDECRLKFDAFPFQQCGTLTGVVKYISNDAFTGNQQQAAMDAMATTDSGGRLNAASRGVTYQARLSLSGRFKGKAEKIPVIPGMRLTAEIKVGERSVISYVFNPFVKALSEAIREP